MRYLFIILISCNCFAQSPQPTPKPNKKYLMAFAAIIGGRGKAKMSAQQQTNQKRTQCYSSKSGGSIITNCY